jgi:hypothetical protein
VKKLLVFIGCLALVSLVNCNQKEKYTLTFKLHDTSISGIHMAYAKLVLIYGNETDQALYSGSSSFSSNTGIIIINDIEENEDYSYAYYVFIDTDDSSFGSTNPVSETGDRIAHSFIDMDDDYTITIDSANGDWATK